MVNNDSCCIARILKVIEVLQNNTTECDLDDGCSKPFLGPSITPICYNTRPIRLYTRNGELFTANYSDGENNLTSTIFRVEKVRDCCCKLRILAGDGITNVTATNNFITVNLKCMCCVQCLDDVALANIC